MFIKLLNIIRVIARRTFSSFQRGLVYVPIERDEKRF